MTIFDYMIWEQIIATGVIGTLALFLMVETPPCTVWARIYRLALGGVAVACLGNSIALMKLWFIYDAGAMYWVMMSWGSALAGLVALLFCLVAWRVTQHPARGTGGAPREVPRFYGAHGWQ